MRIFFLKPDSGCAGNPDLTVESADLSGAADEDMKEEATGDARDADDCKLVNVVVDQNQDQAVGTEAEVMPPPPVPAQKVDAPKHENSDVVEDSISLTLEDEENFDEVSTRPAFAVISKMICELFFIKTKLLFRRKVTLRRKVRLFLHRQFWGSFLGHSKRIFRSAYLSPMSL